MSASALALKDCPSHALTGSFFSSTDHPKALQLYVNLRAAYVHHTVQLNIQSPHSLVLPSSWFDDRLHDFDATALVKFLSILKTLPHLEQLRIRSRTELPAAAWSELRQFCSLKSISIWTFDGPPVGLQGWADKMAPNLVKLELWVRRSHSGSSTSFFPQITRGSSA